MLLPEVRPHRLPRCLIVVPLLLIGQRRDGDQFLSIETNQRRIHQFTDVHDTPDRTFLEWDGHALGHAIAGVTILRTGDDGPIAEVRIHHRPRPALLAFAAELDRRLSAA